MRTRCRSWGCTRESATQATSSAQVVGPGASPIGPAPSDQGRADDQQHYAHDRGMVAHQEVDGSVEAERMTLAGSLTSLRPVGDVHSRKPPPRCNIRQPVSLVSA